MRRLVFGFFLSCAACQCGVSTITMPGDSGSGGGTAGGSSDAGGGSGGGATVDAGPLTFGDFPVTPMFEGSADPTNAPGFFAGTPGAAAGPCVAEPQDGTLFPKDWLRPRFVFATSNGEDLFRLTLTAARQRHQLVVFTTNAVWTMPPAMWGGLTAHAIDTDIEVTVQGVVQATGVTSAVTTTHFRIAPASASGSIVYWTTSNGTRLKGMKVGLEPVVEVMRPDQTGVQCIGCHSSTPDGLYAGMSAAPNPGSGDPATIAIRSVDGLATEPPFLTLTAKTLLAREIQQAPAFSAGHWRDGDRLVVAALSTPSGYELVWTDLEATSDAVDAGWGVLTRDTDGRRAGSVTWSHDGQTVAYVSSDTVGSGVTANGNGDIYTVPWNNRAGGTATALNGASSPDYLEFYPTFSPTDSLLAFSRVPATDGNSYDRPNAEVFVVPNGGGTPHRLVANDPVSCLNVASPGVTNSWPKWGPERTEVRTELSTKTYYWLTFSSKRQAGGRPQLFVAPVVVEDMVIKSYPALYLWNQPQDEANHTPAWDVFQITVN